MKKQFLFYLALVLSGTLFWLISSSPIRAAQPSDFGLKEGDLISAIFSDDPDVYIINEQGYKRLFLNPEIFKFYKHLGGFTNVKLVDPETRDAFPTSGLFRNCEKNDPKVYGIEVTGEDKGALRWINESGEAVVKDDPHFFKKVFCINQKEFEWYPKQEEFKSVKEVPSYIRETVSAIPAIPAISAVPASMASSSQSLAPIAPLSTSPPVASASIVLTPTPSIALPSTTTSTSTSASSSSATSAPVASSSSSFTLPPGAIPIPTPTTSIAPPPPSSVTASSVYNIIRILWPPSADKYLVRRSVRENSYATWSSFGNLQWSKYNGVTTAPDTSYDDFYVIQGYQYRYRVYGCDGTGSLCSTNGTESNTVIHGATPTPTPTYNTRPVISSVSASSITSNSAVISWITDVPATGFVNYGTPTIGIVSPENTSLTTQHSFTLSNLAASSLYNYRVYSHNAYGDQTDLVSGLPPNRTFTTLSGPVSCSSINFTLNDGKTTYIKGVDNFVNYTWTCSPGGSAGVNVGIQKTSGWVSLNTSTDSSTQTFSIDISGDSYPAGVYRFDVCFNVCGSSVNGATFTIAAPTPIPTPSPTPTPVSSKPATVTFSGNDGTWCYDSDYYPEAPWSYRVTHKGYCQDNTGSYFNDSCQNSTTIDEYSCFYNSYYDNAGIIKSTTRCERDGFTCSTTFGGGNFCSDGVCTAIQGSVVPKITIARNLYFGVTGSDVQYLQALLVNEVNYPTNLITGYFGSITREAVKRLQEKYGIKPISGYFGETTRRAVRALISN